MDPAGVQELGRLRPRLLRFALQRLRDREQAEDAVQETLLAALEGMGRYAGGSSLNTWLTGILKHKIVDCVRQSGREQALDPEVHDLPLPDSDPEAALARRRFIDVVELGLTRLSENAARVFVLREVWGLSTAEVCDELAISTSNCCVLLHRARARLRERGELNNLATDLEAA